MNIHLEDHEASGMLNSSQDFIDLSMNTQEDGIKLGNKSSLMPENRIDLEINTYNETTNLDQVELPIFTNTKNQTTNEEEYPNSNIRLITEPTVETPLYESQNTEIEFSSIPSEMTERRLNEDDNFSYERSNMPQMNRFNKYFKQTLLFFAEIFKKYCSLCIRSRFMTFMTLQSILFLLNILNLFSQKIILYSIIGTLVFFIVICLCQWCKRIRQRRSINHALPFYWTRRVSNLGHLYGRTRTISERNQLINRVILNEIRLSELRNQLELYINNINQQQGQRHRRLEINYPLVGFLSQYALAREILELNQTSQNQNRPSGLQQAQIDNLQVEKYSIDEEKSSEGDSGSCTICLEDFKIGDELRKFQCNHRFHKTCVDNWLLLRNTCPNCKHVIN